MRIPLHSFIDLITNSSSETFVASDRQTVSSLEKLVDSILTAGGVTDKRCIDLFRIGLDTVDGGYGHYKAIYVEARDSDCQKAADVLETLNEVFSIRYEDDEQVVAPDEQTANELVNVVNAILSAGKSTLRCGDLFNISGETSEKKTSDEDWNGDDPETILKVEAIKKPLGSNAAKLLQSLDEIFIAENVSSE